MTLLTVAFLIVSAGIGFVAGIVFCDKVLIPLIERLL
jgi:hypothetical protein